MKLVAYAQLVKKFPNCNETGNAITVFTRAHQVRGPVWNLVIRWIVKVKSYYPQAQLLPEGLPLVGYPPLLI